MNKSRAEKNPTKRDQIMAQWRAARAASPFDVANITVGYNGGSFNVPLDIKNLKLGDGNLSCEAPIDLARGF
jgi:hypothetical protein